MTTREPMPPLCHHDDPSWCTAECEAKACKFDAWIKRNLREDRMAKKAQKLNIFQRRYIDERLKSLRYVGSHFAAPSKPSEVRKAEKICEAWERGVDKQRRAFEKKRNDRHTAAYRAVHFGLPEEALAALDAYEAEVRGS